MHRRVGTPGRIHNMYICIGKRNRSCDVIVANHFSHQVIVFEWTYINKTITWSESCPKPSHHMIVFSLPMYICISGPAGAGGRPAVYMLCVVLLLALYCMCIIVALLHVCIIINVFLLLLLYMYTHPPLMNTQIRKPSWGRGAPGERYICLYVCIYIYIYVCMYIYIYICIHEDILYTYTHIQTQLYIYIYICNMCIHVKTYTYYTCTYI